MKTFHIIAKATCNCNLNCSYCYDTGYKEKFKSKTLNYQDLTHLARLVSEYAEEIDWLWHGGEPTTIPIEWYREAQEIFAKHYNTNFKQNLQTNGVNMLRDNKWIDFLRENEIAVGLSFDVFGQDQRMPVTDGLIHSYCELVDRIVNAGVVSRLCIISVITNETVGQMVEMYEYLKQNISTSHYWTASRVTHSIKGERNLEIDSDVTENDLRRFYHHIIHDTSFRPCKETWLTVDLHALLWERSDNSCINSDCKYSRLGIHPDGEMMFCDTPIEGCSIGHVSKFGSIVEIFESEGYQGICDQIDERIENECSKCNYYELCGGWCHHSHIGLEGKMNKCDNETCELVKREMMLVYEQLQELDIQEGINPEVKDLILAKKALTPLEIDTFLKLEGYTKSMILGEVDRNFVTTPQYKIFRIFNDSGLSEGMSRETIFKGKLEVNRDKIEELLREV